VGKVWISCSSANRIATAWVDEAGV